MKLSFHKNTSRRKSTSRRSFIALLLSFFTLSSNACSKEKILEPSKPIELGEFKDFIGKTTEISLYRVTIFSDELGLRAVKMVCTHQSCGLNRNLNGFTCPCHGSKFSNTGLVLRGPAINPLAHLKLSLSKDGGLKVWPRESVGANWRLSTNV